MKRLMTAVILMLLILMVGADTWAQSSARSIRMAYLQNDIHHLALWVALERGLFKKNGADVEVKGVFKAGPEIMTAFAAGELDMAYVGEAPSTTAVANKAAKVVVVSQVNTEGSALVVAKSKSDFNNLADLQGKTVAVPGHSTVQDFLLRRALRDNGMAPRQVNIIVLKPPEMIGALRIGQIDAFIAWEPYPSKADTMSVGRNLATSKEMWPGHPCCVLVADRGFFDSHPETIAAVVKSHVQATDYIHQNPEEAVTIGIKYTGMDEATVRQAVQNVTYTYELSIQGEKEYVQFLSDLGYIRLDNPDGFVDQFINPDILKGILSQ
ncbi:MAG: ABC transporter substrate-binding protein [Desulfobacterales bacterium]